MKRLLAVLLFLGLAAASARAAVVINEIMYHPASEKTSEEWLELYNTGAAAMDLSGWKFTNGVEFTFPAATSIPAGAYLVVAADAAVFHANHPAVANYVGGWSGVLSNSSNKLVLQDALGQTVSTVHYADDGDWGVLRKDYWPDEGHKGWHWDSGADGGTTPTPAGETGADPFPKSRSLELINAGFPADYGQNWAPSAAAGGTPGAQNSVAAADIAPVITEARHFPLVPTHNDPIAVTARVQNDDGGPVTATLHWRVCASASPYADPAFTTAAMLDNGAQQDAAAGDGVYGYVLPAQANGAIIEFYFEAKDAAGHTRYWPAPALDDTLASVQTQNCLLQVDDTVYAGAQPLYRLVMKPADKAELVQINAKTPAAPYPTTDQSLSHANFSATWLTMDGTGEELRYRVTVRNRGHGSRTALPQSLNVSFENAQPWKSVTSLNLNTQTTYSQLFGSALLRKAGLAGPESRAVQVRWNNANPTSSTGAPSYSFYVANEVQDSAFAEHHFPLDSSGNVYRAQRTDSTPPANTLSEADLSYKAPATGQLPPDPYRTVYFKHSNSSEDDWSDLIAMTQALSKGHSAADFSTTYDAGYETSVLATVDVGQWMRFLAVQALVDNDETNISNGYGDDFYLYFGITDKRGKLVPYDLDTICGQGDTKPTSATQHDIWRMVAKDNGQGANSTTPQVVMNAFMKHPAFVPVYYRHLKELIDGPFAQANFNALVDTVLTGVVPQAQIDSIKNFQNARTPYVATLIPLQISVTSATTTGGTALTVTNGYPRSTANACALTGKANAIDTRSVKVNGVDAVWTAWKATWSAPNVALNPGINKILIQTFDADQKELDRFTYDVWYDDSTVTSVSGTLSASATWTAANSPYRITANTVIPAGVTLTIQPGVTVYVASGATIQVNGTGKISAVGTETQRIVFAHEPGATGTTWGSLDFIGTTVESTLSYVSFSDCGGTTIGGHNAQVHVNNAIVFFDHLYFPPTPVVQFISFDAPSFIVQNSYFSTYPPPSGPESLHGINGIMSGGHGIFRDNYFGHTWGFNDTIDYTGGNRPGPILQFIGNVFDGASDDNLDLDSTDAWIEGNIFMHVHRDPTRTDDSRDTGSAISGGVDTVGQNPDWTIINNLFYDVDHVFLNKGGSTTTGNGGGRVALLYNTVIHVAKEGSGSPLSDIAAFDWSDDGIVAPDASIGSGMYAAHNIVYDCSVLHHLYDPAHHTVIMDNNILSVPWTGPGSGNQVVDPRLNLGALAGTPVANVTAAQLREAAKLLPGSPAIGAGFGGLNIGGLQKHGIVIAGEPIGTTNATSATLTVGPGGTFNWGTTAAQRFGWTAFKWKLDNGAWSAEIPVANNSPFTSPATISLTGLGNGPHTVYVTGKNDAGYYQDDPFVYSAGSSYPAAATASKTWTVNTSYTPPPATPNVRINEVLAKNAETQNFGLVYPDIIELYNAGGATADLTGWGLTDNPTIPYKYAFPAGTTLPAGGYLVVYADSSASVPTPRTGFGLKAGGDSLTLTKSAAAGGGVADSVAFGNQLSDYSIGRRAYDSVWDLCAPTFGSANVVAAQAAPAKVKINEWLADSRVLANTDFVELFNTATLPVNLGGCYLTDNPVEYVTRSQIPALTFIAANGYASFKADGDPGQGSDHLTFKLASTQGEIGLFDADQSLIDNIVYGPQSTDVSQGRTPNGSATITIFSQPTPGAPNPETVGTTSTSTTTANVIPATQSWKYYANATAGPANDASGKSFTDPAYNDSAWVSAPQLLYIEDAALTNTDGFTKATALPGYNTTHPYQTYYFRTHFTWSGGLVNNTLQAKIMLDDGAVIYLNGVEVTRVRMAAGAVTYATHASGSVTDATVETLVNLPASALVAGDNVIAVSVHQNSTSNQSASAGSSDIVWGMKLDVVTTTTVTNGNQVIINEVLARNATLTNPGGGLAGWIELFNPGSTAQDVSGMSLTNDLGAPQKWVAPVGASVPAGGYLVIYCDGTQPASATNTGFALNGMGDALYFFNAAAVGGGLHDSVTFGLQVPDFSIGRTPDGTGPFALNVPSRGALNTAAAVASISSIKINEWMAYPATYDVDWFELYNTAAQPVLLGGNYLTDNLSQRKKHLVPPLTFIGTGANRWLRLDADNASSAANGHVSFALDPLGESVGLFSAGGVQIDAVTFGSQAFNTASGRYPDGASTIIAMPGVATPGAANQAPPADTDHDNIPDAWEIAHGLNPNSAADAALDSDADGQSNLAEYLAGTDPHDAQSLFKVSATPNGVPGQMVIHVSAQPNRSYTVQFKNNLTDAVWQKLTDIAPSASAQNVDVTDPSVGTNPRRFYRVVSPAQP